MQPDISAIIPVYNAEDYLEQCIKSVLNQTCSSWELILVNDGSTDNSGAICDKYATMDDRIKVFHKENGGVSSARNLGINNALGEYITFIDSDDYVDNSFFEAALRIIHINNAEVYISGIKEEFWNNNSKIKESIYTNKFSIKRYSAKQLLEAHRHDFPTICISGPCCKLFTRSILVENSIFFSPELSRGEDALFNLKVIGFCKSFVFDNNIYYHYRRGNLDSLYSRFCPELYDVHLVLYRQREILLEQYKCSKATCNEYKRAYVFDLLSCISHSFKFHLGNSFHHRMLIIKRVSTDHCLRNISFADFSGKNRIILWMAYNRWHHILYLLYHLRYVTKDQMRAIFKKVA